VRNGSVARAPTFAGKKENCEIADGAVGKNKASHPMNAFKQLK